MNIELTEEQNQVIRKTLETLFDKKESVFISGQAGTGKTTIANSIADLLLEKGMNVYFTAATHTAANRLSKTLSDKNNVLAVTTIHKFLQMRLTEEQYGKKIFSFNDQFVFPDNSVLIIDEGSMLNISIFKYTEDRCFPWVIILGDSVQIPPVTEDDPQKTRILTIEDSEPPVSFMKNKIELTTVHRQNQETGLFQLCKFIRDEIINGNAVKLYNDKEILIDKIIELESLDDDTIFFDIPQNEVVEAIKNIEDTCFLAFGNATINAVQKHLPEWYIDGGYGITNGAVVRKTDDGNVVLFNNNTHIKIDRIERMHHNQWGVNFDRITSMGCQFLCPTDMDNFDTFYQMWIESALFNANKVPAISLECAKYFHRNDWISITNKSLNEFMNGVTTIREGRVSTVHRAQGMEWKHVIIAYDNIMFAGKNLTKGKRVKDDHRKIIAMKLLYTAISRAREKVVFCFGYRNDGYNPG